MDLILQLLQTVLFTSIIICIVWGITYLVRGNAGYRWRKYLWLLIAVRLIIPVNIGLFGYTAPVNIAILAGSMFSSSDRLAEIAEGSNTIGNPADIEGLGDNNSLGNIQNGNKVSADNTPADANRNINNVSKNDANQNNSDINNCENINAFSIRGFGRSILALFDKLMISKTAAGVFILIWITGIILCAAFRIFQYVYARRKYLRNSSVSVNEALILAVENICSEYNIRKSPMVMDCSLSTSPMLMGYFKTMLIVPELDYTPAELDYVLRHELNHYRAKDLWYKLLMVVLCDVYWFNPVFRLMKRMAFQDTEYVCDENTTSSMTLEKKKDYCNTLLKIMKLSSGHSLSFTTQFSSDKKKALKRFDNIFAFHSKKTGAVLLSLLLVLVIGTTACVSFRGEPDGNIESDENNTDKISIRLDSRFFDKYSDERVLDALKNEFPDYDIMVNGVLDYSYDLTAEEFTAQGATVYDAGVSEVAGGIDEDKFADITDIARTRGYLDNMSDAAKAMVSDENGRVYAITTPVYYSFALVCNTDLFVEAGLADENGNALLPATWEEAAKAAQTIKEETGKAGFGFIGQEQVTAAWHFINMAWDFGAGDLCIKNEDGTYTANVNSEGAVAAMEYIKSLRWQYNALTEHPETEDYNTLIEKVAKGEAAMCIGYTDSIKMYSDYGIEPDKLAFTALPAGPSGEAYTYLEGEAIAFSASATPEQIEAALDCMEFMGCVPILNDATKEKIASRTNNAYIYNAYALKNIDSFSSSEFAAYRYGTLAGDYGMEAYPDTERFAQTAVIDNFRCEPYGINSQYYLAVAEVIAKVIADGNADVALLMDEANERFQSALDE